MPGRVAPHAQSGTPFGTAGELRDAMARVVGIRDRLLAEMIARQEEMDWLVYAAYGLIGAAGPVLPEADLVLARNQRPFRLWARAEGDLARAFTLMPRDWSPARKALWKARLEVLRDNEAVRRIEQSVYKRRWDEQWKIGPAWQCGPPADDAEFLDAFAWWLSEKAEWWLKHACTGPTELGEWTAALWTDARVQAGWQVAAEARCRLEVWKRDQEETPSGKPLTANSSRSAFAKFFKGLVHSQSGPEGVPFGASWDEVEMKVKVPAAVKTLRGKLNVPRERFWITSDRRYRVAHPLGD
jgi:hypothetical protein